MIEKLKSLLNKGLYNFELIESDKPILTTYDAKEYFDIQKAAPVIILKTDLGFYALVKSSSIEKIDLQSLKKIIGCNKTKLASKYEVNEVVNCGIGEVPLIGLNIPYIFDNSLMIHDFIYGGTGNAYFTLKISPIDVIKINKISIFFN